ncbi:glycosyltransferase family 25 protein [Ursidibacter arcticus]
MLKSYVINLDRQPERLHSFYQNSSAKSFLRLPAVDKKVLELIKPNFLFNLTKIENKINRPITLGEIACTLSHIKTWEYIAKDENIDDNSLVLIAEDDIRLIENFDAYLKNILPSLQKKDIDIVILHKLGLYSSHSVYNGEELTAYFPQDDYECDNDGSSLYLIRKSKAKQLILSLESNKPYWLADHFSSFCDLNRILILSSSFGYISTDHISDLEQDRNIARNLSI